jgi:hypothetical protein
MSYFQAEKIIKSKSKVSLLGDICKVYKSSLI